MILHQASHISTAEDKDAPEEIVKRKVDEVISVLKKKDLSEQTRENKIVEIVSPLFDFQTMAKLSLGRKHWTNLSKENQEKFTELFIKRLKASYFNKMTLYTDEKIVYAPPIQEKRKVHIPTHLVAKDGKTAMLYKLYESEKGWKLYDIEIEGVSIRHYDVIYNLIDDVSKALQGMLEPTMVEVIEGRAEVREVFPAGKRAKVAGVYITEGRVTRGSPVRVLRQGNVIHESVVSSLRRFKDDVREVATGFECGVGVQGLNDYEVGDILEFFRSEEAV